jgi:3-hydroxymyristoyl/3-hydroxydecanoyl-(acyl carrier protein) dehydratase
MEVYIDQSKITLMFEEDIISLIPQRPPFVMVDRVLHSDERLTRTAFRVAPDNIFVENGRLREPGLLENIAQTAAARAGLLAREAGRPVEIGYIGAVRNLEILDLPPVGEEIITEIEIGEPVLAVAVIEGKIWCGKVLIAACEMRIFPAGEAKGTDLT